MAPRRGVGSEIHADSEIYADSASGVEFTAPSSYLGTLPSACQHCRCSSSASEPLVISRQTMGMHTLGSNEWHAHCNIGTVWRRCNMNNPLAHLASHIATHHLRVPDGLEFPVTTAGSGYAPGPTNLHDRSLTPQTLARLLHPARVDRDYIPYASPMPIPVRLSEEHRKQRTCEQCQEHRRAFPSP